MNKKSPPSGPGLPGDPAIFKVFTEISIIARLADREFERVMPGDLTLAQFAIINHLLRLDAQQTIGEIASAMQVAQPTMSSTVKKLEAKSHVEFVPDTEDRRVKRVRVTPSGRAARDAAVEAVGPGLAKLRAALPDADWPGILDQLTPLRTLLDSMR